MFLEQVVVLCALLVVTSAKDLVFPPGFKFGAATAAYQVEGAWNVSATVPFMPEYSNVYTLLLGGRISDTAVVPTWMILVKPLVPNTAVPEHEGKGESIWDSFTHTRPDLIVNAANGDEACDSYHLWRRDIEMASELGLHFYRFSLSWGRILPSGFTDRVSEDGVRYYNNLIDGLLEKGIEPFITIYHWDLPQVLQNLGGWTNPLIVDWFADYARIVFSLYADRVKLWLTFNEPLSFCDGSYTYEVLAPDVVDPEVGAYLCNKNVLMAHAKAWRIYDQEFRPKYGGEVSLANQLIWCEPLSSEHEELTEMVRENWIGRYSHPIFSKEGGWPTALEKKIFENSKKKGYPRSLLPEISQEEKEFVRGTFDFYAFNHYTSRLIRKAHEGEKPSIFPFGDFQLDAIMEKHPDWATSPVPWLYVNPEGIRHQLVWLKKQYGDMRILITENGLPSKTGLNDQDRIQYYRDYLAQILRAIKEDGVNVTHYTAWTLMDNFEWSDGYTVKFGLYEVDFSHPNRTRTPRVSAAFYADVIRRHALESPDH